MWNHVAPIPEEPREPYSDVPRARILIVEADPAFRTLVARRLDLDGYEVYQASTGAEALSMLQFVGRLGWPNDTFDLVILDSLGRPGVGMASLRGLRSEAWTPPALMLTGPGEEDLAEAARRAGATLLVRPFSLDRLCDEVAQTLALTAGAVPRYGPT
jgi:DNA-binding response OmpR family regulator